MKTLLLVLSLMILATASYAVNVGDIVGGYPAGYNSNDPGAFRAHIGQAVTPTFMPTTTGVSPDGTLEGPFPAGYGFTPGTTSVNEAFLDNFGTETANDQEVKGKSFIREGDMLNNTIRTVQTNNLANNLQVLVAGSNAHSVSNLGFYVGYKVVSISW
jgi:hypothetical protein